MRLRRKRRKEALDMFWKKPIVKPAECPACGGDVLMPAMKAYRYAGGEREHVGDVCDCVGCGTRLTVLFVGGVVRYRPNVPSVLSEKLGRSSDKVAGENALSSLPLDVNDLDGLL